MMKSNQLLQSADAHNPSTQQPPSKFLRLPQVLEVFPVSKSSWWAGVKSGKYPKSVKLGCRTTAWS